MQLLHCSSVQLLICDQLHLVKAVSSISCQGRCPPNVFVNDQASQPKTTSAKLKKTNRQIVDLSRPQPAPSSPYQEHGSVPRVHISAPTSPSYSARPARTARMARMYAPFTAAVSRQSASRYRMPATIFARTDPLSTSDHSTRSLPVRTTSILHAKADFHAAGGYRLHLARSLPSLQGLHGVKPTNIGKHRTTDKHIAWNPKNPQFD